MTVEKSNFVIKGIGAWLIAISTVVIALAILFGAPISPLWMLCPIAIPVACAVIIPLLIVAFVVGILAVSIVCFVLAIVPVTLLALCVGSLEFTKSVKKKKIDF